MKPQSEQSREDLINRIQSLERELEKERKKSKASVEKTKSSSLFEFSEKGLRLKLYRLLLEKYADIINEKEERTIGEVKGLINPDDLTIQSIVSGFKPNNYSFEKNFLNSAKKAFEFVKKEIFFAKADIDLDYFLSPREIMTYKVADDEDQAVFLCSILLALENENAGVVIAELNDLTTHAFVVFEFNGRAYFLDPTQDHSFEQFSGKTEKIMKDYSFKSAKIKRLLYKFNNFEYKSFIEEE